MLIDNRFRDYEVETDHYTCPYHQENPDDRSYPGCTCSSSWKLKSKPKDVKDVLEE